MCLPLCPINNVSNPSSYLDPLHTQIELLPTDKGLMLRKQQKAQNTLSPHLRVLQFFESHFNAIRLGNLQDQQLFCRLVSTTVVGLSKTQGHPLAREIHFRIVLFGLKVLRNLSPHNNAAVWKLKDQILTAALSWFKHPPRYDIGFLGVSNNIILIAIDGHLVAIACRSRPKTRFSVKSYLLYEALPTLPPTLMGLISLCKPSKN